LAFVDQNKVTAYLLSDHHPVGRGKAVFVQRFGFHRSAWWELRDALLRHALTGRATAPIRTEFGTKFTLVGPLPSPDGRAPFVRSVWFVAEGEVVPRLVTAYPAEGEVE